MWLPLSPGRLPAFMLSITAELLQAGCDMIVYLPGRLLAWPLHSSVSVQLHCEPGNPHASCPLSADLAVKLAGAAGKDLYS